jgi:hypothetical protein
MAERYYEIVLSIQLQAPSAEAAMAKGEQLAEGLSKKLGPAELQCVWRIRDEEVRNGRA